jgi:hypothetical protein
VTGVDLIWARIIVPHGSSAVDLTPTMSRPTSGRMISTFWLLAPEGVGV